MTYLRELAKFYLRCLMGALFSTYFAVVGWIGFAAFLISFFAQLYPEHIPSDFGFLKSSEAVFLPATVAALIFFIRLIDMPFSLYKTEADRRQTLENESQPRLAIEITDPNGSDQCRTITNETVGGMRFPHTTLIYRSAVSLTVTNQSRFRAGPCVAELLSAKRFFNGQLEEIKFVESIKLAWNVESTEASLEETINAGRSKRIWLASADYNGNLWVLRDKDNLLSDQQLIFGPVGKYQAEIQVSDGYSSPAVVTVEIVCNPANTGHHMSAGKVSIRFV